MLYHKIKALKSRANNRSIQTNFSTNNSTVRMYHLTLENKNQKFQNITIENKSQRESELSALIQYQSLFKKIKDPNSQKKSLNESLQIKNSCTNLKSKSCAKTRNFHTKIWRKVNYDEDSYADRKFSIERVETNKDSKVLPCLKIQQAQKFLRSNSNLSNLRYQRSGSVLRQNVVLVFVENYLQQNKHPQKI
ncbi:unnamed protein product [Paramecium sonneborni]|uniref:Uncharacterized protein n=1 Tax=Paramecium sonneborni TaxID=65129 RepID=A0A8S1KHE8_9CILI|nr:unnamed protein product [Paramecium sonneborni]